MNLYIMYNVHMIWFDKSMKKMSYLNFNVALAKVFIKKGACFILKATTMVGPFIPNLEKLYYFMDRNIEEKKGVCDI